MHDVQHPHDDEPTECRECGSTFDLARQNYYADKCPDCYDRPDDLPTTSCVHPECPTELPPSEMHLSEDATPYDVRGPGYVCPEHRDYSWTPSRGV